MKIDTITKEHWNKGNKHRLGKTFSEESKRKIGLANSGERSAWWGKKHTEEWKIAASLRKRGEKCNFWKGGITPKYRLIRNSPEYRLWREAVFARDNWTCQECNMRGSYLHAHHIKPFATYPELRFAIDNGLTLCKACHEMQHGHKIPILKRKFNVKD